MAGNPGDDFEALARRYWTAWGDVLRGAVPGAGAGGMPGMGAIPGMGGAEAGPSAADAWRQWIDGWARLAHGGRAQADDAVAHFNRQARDGYARMQEVAARFAGQDPGAADVAGAWREALGASGSNPFPEMLRAMRGHGLQGLEQWVEDAAPWLESMRGEGLSWLRLPAFGPGREHQERMQALAGHMAAYQQASAAYNALLLRAQQDAFAIFESKLEARGEAGDRIGSARALFDLWVDAAEEAYAEIAMSPEFGRAYGDLVNGQMRVRAGVQRMVEDACAQLGMPTRSELDGAHRRLAGLEREVRRLRDAARATQRGGRGEQGDAATEAVATGKAAAKKRAPAKAAAKKPARRQAAPQETVAKRAARKQAAPQEAVAKRAARKRPATKKSTRKVVKKGGR